MKPCVASRIGAGAALAVSKVSGMDGHKEQQGSGYSSLNCAACCKWGQSNYAASLPVAVSDAASQCLSVTGGVTRRRHAGSGLRRRRPTRRQGETPRCAVHLSTYTAVLRFTPQDPRHVWSSPHVYMSPASGPCTSREPATHETRPRPDARVTTGRDGRRAAGATRAGRSFMVKHAMADAGQ